MILAACILGLIWGLLRKGRLASIFKKKFRLPILLFLSLACEGLLSWPWFCGRVGSFSWYAFLRIALAVMQYSLLLLFLFRNRFKPGMYGLMAGSLMNGLVIIANSGKMPIGPYIQRFGAEAVARIAEAPHYFLAAGGEPLLFLADLIPFWTLSWYMISLGDILISIGIFRLAAYMPRRLVRPGGRTKDVEHPDDFRYTVGR